MMKLDTHDTMYTADTILLPYIKHPGTNPLLATHKTRPKLLWQAQAIVKVVPRPFSDYKKIERVKSALKLIIDNGGASSELDALQKYAGTKKPMSPAERAGVTTSGFAPGVGHCRLLEHACSPPELVSAGGAGGASAAGVGWGRARAPPR